MRTRGHVQVCAETICIFVSKPILESPKQKWTTLERKRIVSVPKLLSVPVLEGLGTKKSDQRVSICYRVPPLRIGT